MIPMTLPERIAGKQRKACRELDHPEDDQDPAHGVEVGEDVPLVVYEGVRIVQGADPVDDVERADNQQKRRRQHGSTYTAHDYLLGLPTAGADCTGAT